MRKVTATTTRRLILFGWLIIQPFLTKAQEQDFGAWYGLDLKYGITNRLSANLNSSLRTVNNASNIDVLYVEGGLSYKIIKYISLGGYYRWIYNNEFDNTFFSRHRWYADIKAEYPFGRFEISARFRYQTQYKTFITEDNDLIPDHYGRLKTQVYYNWPSFPVNPYVSFELFYPWNYNSKSFADKKRLAIGIQYKVKKKQSIDAEYIFQRDYLPRMADLNVISLTYKFSF